MNISIKNSLFKHRKTVNMIFLCFYTIKWTKVSIKRNKETHAN